MRAEFERQLRAQTPPVAGVNPDVLLEQEARQRMEEERARLAAINARQIESNGLVIDEGNSVKGGSGPATAGRATTRPSSPRPRPRATRRFARIRIGNPARTIVQGTILEAALESAVDTDLPGAIRAVLTVDVLSYDGTSVLLPRGTRLIGTYSSKVKIAQSRALVAWNRAITPGGTSVELGGIGGDELGRSGQTGDVDTHFWKRFGSAALISLIGAGSQVVIDDDTNEDVAETADDLADDLEGSTQSVLGEYLRIPPTIHVEQGARLTVFVNRDLVF